ncbi:tetratricopeptide repeat-containing sensor histidine kinase [Chryseosolibacter indicus]|uniref:histidine kinase n=1 Tax=Chryseosolibacter indicus TaxID=2782351 RepID=A0ABS5VR62_9BACT|nr:tetratricopeptide repeat protein [Chryseosolibacter indicus]MBT1703334.1 tetratricopeptide repeat protein [Chryseosolibacter indicus]
MSTIISKLRISLLLLFLLHFVNISYGQHKLDSLKAAAIHYITQDTLRVNTLIELSEQYYWAGSYEQALEASKSAQTLAHRIKFEKGEGEAWLTSGHAYLRKGEYDSALNDLDKAEAIFLKVKEHLKLANTYLYKGQVNDLLASYSQALNYYKLAKDVVDQHPNEQMLVKILNSYGITNYNKGSYETALDYYLQTLKKSEHFSDKMYYASTLNNIGVVHVTLNQYDEALKYFLKYLETMRTLGRKQNIAVALLNVGEAYINLDNNRQGIHYLDSALFIYKEINDKRGISLANSNLGDGYKNLKEYAIAEKHYKEAIAIATSIKSEESLVKALIGASELYLSTGDKQKMTGVLEHATNTAKRIGSVLWLEKAYLLRSKLDSANGDYKDAYLAYKQYASLSDSLFNERKSQQVAQMRELFESEKKDKEILLLQEAKKLEEVKASGNQRILALSVAFLVLIIACILYWVYHKFRHTLILERKNQKILYAYKELKILMDRVELQNKMLAAKNETLEDLHREKDGLIGIVAHDLRSPLNKIAGLAEILKENQRLNSEDGEIVKIIQKVCKDGNGLIRDLLDINQFEHCEELNVSSVDIKEYTQNLVNHYSHQLKRKALNLTLNCKTDLNLVTDIGYLTRILDNILTNAIKFSPLHRNIYFTISSEHEGMVKMIIRDEGQGFHSKDLPYLFRKFKKLSAKPTAGESSTGLGLSIVKSLTEKIKGTIRVESEWGKGATFILEFPREISLGMSSTHETVALSAER